MFWLTFVLLGAFTGSLVNVTDKYLVVNRIQDNVVLTTYKGLVYGLIGIILMSYLGFRETTLTTIILSFTSGILLIIYVIPYFKALKTEDVSRLVPLYNLIPIFVLIFSYIFLREKLTIQQFIGFLLIFSGSIILSTRKIKKDSFTLRKSTFYMFLSCLLYTPVVILFKYALNNSDFWTILSYQMIGAGTTSIFLIFFWIKKRFQKQTKILTMSTILLIGGSNSMLFSTNLLTSYALSLAPVALVSVVGGTQSGFLILEGFMLSLWFPNIIKEDTRFSTIFIKILSVAIMIAGIYYIYK